jgi:hypothetical protein
MYVHHRLIAPDDREQFFVDFQRLFFTTGERTNTLAKVRGYIYVTPPRAGVWHEETAAI